MKHSLKAKLILSYLIVAILTVSIVVIAIRLTSGQFMMNLVVDQQTAALQDSAVTYYENNGSMDGFFEYYLQSQHTQPQDINPDQMDDKDKPPIPFDSPDSHELRGVYGLVDTEYRALMPTAGYDIGKIVPAEKLQQAVAVKVDGEIIAWILPDTKFEFQLNSQEELFLQRTSLAVGLAAGAGVLVAIIMGFFLAGVLIKPIRRLSVASKAMASGVLEQELPVTSQDELGELTTTFNQMSSDLAKADQQRKRMTADITHDLSTPLQIISGYIEMLEGGEVSLTPQRIDIIKTEIGHLRRLVDDLSTLSHVEAGGLNIQMEPVQPDQLLRRMVQAYQPITEHAGIMLNLKLTDEPIIIQADEGRLQQVLKNLIENALRYTPKNGTITLSLSRVGSLVEITVKDSGSGIEAEDLPYVFDRFYRADKSRSGNSGKMGLGLAICKALVQAQNGSIHAESLGKGLGTSMIVRFESKAA
jgi:signal transduction histidine kinase